MPTTSSVLSLLLLSCWLWWWRIWLFNPFNLHTLGLCTTVNPAPSILSCLALGFLLAEALDRDFSKQALKGDIFSEQALVGDSSELRDRGGGVRLQGCHDSNPGGGVPIKHTHLLQMGFLFLFQQQIQNPPLLSHHQSVCLFLPGLMWQQTNCTNWHCRCDKTLEEFFTMEWNFLGILFPHL